MLSAKQESPPPPTGFVKPYVVDLCAIWYRDDPIRAQLSLEHRLFPKYYWMFMLGFLGFAWFISLMITTAFPRLPNPPPPWFLTCFRIAPYFATFWLVVFLPAVSFLKLRNKPARLMFDRPVLSYPSHLDWDERDLSSIGGVAVVSGMYTSSGRNRESNHLNQIVVWINGSSEDRWHPIFCTCRQRAGCLRLAQETARQMAVPCYEIRPKHKILIDELTWLDRPWTKRATQPPGWNHSG